MRIVMIRGSSQRMVRKKSDKINGFINTGLYESFLLTCSMFKSRILQVFYGLPGRRQLAGAAARASLRITADQIVQSCIDDRCSSLSRKLMELGRSNNRCCRKTNSPVFLNTHETAFHSSRIPVAGSARSGFCHFSLHEKAPWTRACVIGAIASGGECVSALREGSAVGSEFLDLISIPDFRPVHCFIMNNIAFRQSSMEWNSVRLRAQLTEDSPRISRR